MSGDDLVVSCPHGARAKRGCSVNTHISMQAIMTLTTRQQDCPALLASVCARWDAKGWLPRFICIATCKSPGVHLVARCRDDGPDPACPELMQSTLGAEGCQAAETAGTGLQWCRPAVHDRHLGRWRRRGEHVDDCARRAVVLMLAIALRLRELQRVLANTLPQQFA